MNINKKEILKKKENVKEDTRRKERGEKIEEKIQRRFKMPI